MIDQIEHQWKSTPLSWEILSMKTEKRMKNLPRMHYHLCFLHNILVMYLCLNLIRSVFLMIHNYYYGITTIVMCKDNRNFIQTDIHTHTQPMFLIFKYLIVNDWKQNWKRIHITRNVASATTKIINRGVKAHQTID